VPDGDGGADDGLNDGRVELYHHSPWQVEFPQLPYAYNSQVVKIYLCSSSNSTAQQAFVRCHVK